MDQKKKVYIVLATLALLFLTSCVGQANEPILRSIKPIFGALPELLNTASPDGIIYVRFVIFVAIFALFYVGTTKIFEGPKHHRPATIIALSLSLLTTIAIPERILIAIVGTYSGIMGVLLALVPTIACLYLAHTYFKEDTTFNRIMKFILYLLVAYLTGLFNEALSVAGASDTSLGWQGATYLYEQLQIWMPISQLILIVAAIANLFGAFGHGAAATVGGVQQDYRSVRGANNQEEARAIQQAQTTQTVENTQKADAVAKAQAKNATDSLKKLAESIRNAKV